MNRLKTLLVLATMLTFSAALAWAHGDYQCNENCKGCAEKAKSHQANKAPASSAALPVAAAADAPSEVNSVHAANVKINIDGLHCGACVKKVTEKLSALTDIIEPGSVQVDLKTNTAKVFIKKGKLSTAEAKKLKGTLNEVLNSSGYTVKKVEMIN